MHMFNFRNLLAESKLYICERFIATKITIKNRRWILALYNFDTHCGNPKIRNFKAMMRIIIVIVSAWFMMLDKRRICVRNGLIYNDIIRSGCRASYACQCEVLHVTESGHDSSMWIWENLICLHCAACHRNL